MESIDYIDSYFKGELTPEEVRQFELRIEQDPVFAQDVAFYVSASGILKEAAEEGVKERFWELEQMQPVKMKQSPVRKLVYWMAAAAVSVGVIFRVFLVGPTPVSKLADNYIKENLVELSQPMSLGDSISIGAGFYNKGEYSKALSMFEELLDDYPTNERVLEYAGIASLKTGNMDNALQYFERLASISLYANPGKFYQAITLMKRNNKGDVIKAKALLNEVVKNKLSYYNEAEVLLKKM